MNARPHPNESAEAARLPPESPDIVEELLAVKIDNIVPTRGYQMTPMVGIGGSVGSTQQVVEKQLNRRREEFLATLGHELRNPLAAIKGGLQLLRSSKSAETTKAYALEIVDRQVDQMQRLINDLLEVSRIVQGKISIRPEPIELQELVRQAATMNRETVTKSPVILNWTYRKRELRSWLTRYGSLRSSPISSRMP